MHPQPVTREQFLIPSFPEDLAPLGGNYSRPEFGKTRLRPAGYAAARYDQIAPSQFGKKSD